MSSTHMAPLIGGAIGVGVFIAAMVASFIRTKLMEQYVKGWNDCIDKGEGGYPVPRLEIGP